MNVGRFTFGSPTYGRHTGSMYGLWLSLLFGAPWLAAIIWIWSRVPRTDVVPPSMGEQALQRLSTI